MIHLVNWKLGHAGERAEICRNVTLTLLAPPRWGPPASARYLQPGQETVIVEPELHEDCVRLTPPRLEAWGLVEIRPASDSGL